MPTLAQIRTALKDTIAENIEELTGYENVPESVNTPAVLVIPKTADFMRAFGRGLDTYSFDLLVLTSRRDDGLAQDDLDKFITGSGADSIRRVVFENRALGRDDVSDSVVTGVTEYGGTFQVSGVDYFGARLNVDVYVSGTA